MVERAAAAGDPRLVVTFPVELPASATVADVEQWLAASGFTRVQAEREVASPTGPRQGARRGRRPVSDGGGREGAGVEAIETALKRGGGRVDVHVVGEGLRQAQPEREVVGEGLRQAQPEREVMGEGLRQAQPERGGVGERVPSSVRGELTPALGELTPVRAELTLALAGTTSVQVEPTPAQVEPTPVQIEPTPVRAGPTPVRAEPVEALPATIWRYSTGLHDPDSDLRYADPQPGLFSFNSAYGACETCRGFGRVIGVDYGLVIPDGKKTLRGGAIKPMQTPAWKDCQDDLLKYGGEAGIPRDTPWMQLTPAQRDWVIGGTPNWAGNWNKQWYGVKRFFEYLESKAYKMHIRVLLSKYRSYTPCEVCGGARLKLAALLWRLGSKDDADAGLPPDRRFMPRGVDWSRAQLEALPGLTVHDLMLIPLDRLHRFFDRLTLPSTLLDDALKLLLDEIRTRLRYLCDVGIGYLTLDRQSRTLSGGEVQRINLTTALGTSLVNTMFVLDEPSIGLHPRDMGRIVEAMHRLRDAGNTLVVVEHDPAVMLARGPPDRHGSRPGRARRPHRVRRHAGGDSQR